MMPIQINWELAFHKCLRPEDSDKIISDTYYFLKGNPEQYRSFKWYANKMQSPLSEADFVHIMRLLIISVESDFNRAFIDFWLIYTNSTEDWKEKGTAILSLFD